VVGRTVIVHNADRTQWRFDCELTPGRRQGAAPVTWRTPLRSAGSMAATLWCRRQSSGRCAWLS